MCSPLGIRSPTAQRRRGVTSGCADTCPAGQARDGLAELRASFKAADIARELGGAQRGGDGWWHAKCPAHQDGKSSLALKDAEDGGVIWNYMAGCDKRDVDSALRACGMLQERPEPDRKAKRTIVAIYDYKDASGVLLFPVLRNRPKDPVRGGPDAEGPGERLWRLGDLIRPLYRLPELPAADPIEPVFLVEGEKDVDRLRSLGLIATTTAQGAKGWA